MNIAKVIEQRQAQWAELETYVGDWNSQERIVSASQKGVLRFAELYRSACADLALADAYQLPPSTVAYLHRLVARAHNRLYRAGKINPITWVETIFRTAPQQIFFGPLCASGGFAVFRSLYSFSTGGTYRTAIPKLRAIVSRREALEGMEQSFETKVHGSFDHYVIMAGTTSCITQASV